MLQMCTGLNPACPIPMAMGACGGVCKAHVQPGGADPPECAACPTAMTLYTSMMVCLMQQCIPESNNCNANPASPGACMAGMRCVYGTCVTPATGGGCGGGFASDCRCSPTFEWGYHLVYEVTYGTVGRVHVRS